MNSPHKGQWRGALIFSLIWTWINSWVNNPEVGDLRRHRAHCEVSVMHLWPQKLYRAFRFGTPWLISCSYPRHSQLTRHSLMLANGRIRQSLTALVISSQHPWMLEKDSLITVSGLEWESLYQLVNRGPGWTCMQWNLVTVSSLTITQHSYITILTMWSNSDQTHKRLLIQTVKFLWYFEENWSCYDGVCLYNSSRPGFHASHQYYKTV